MEGIPKMHFLHHPEYTVFFYVIGLVTSNTFFFSENHTEHKNLHVWNHRTLLIVRTRGTYN